MKKRVLALVLGVMMIGGSVLPAAAEENSADHVKMAIQQYNFRVGGDWDNVASMEDVNDILAKLSEAGYEGVEWVNFMLNDEWMDLDAVKATMDELGMESCGLHYHYDSEDPEGSAATAVERCQKLGCNRLIFAFSKPSTFGMEADEDGNWTTEQIDQWAEEVNKVIDTLQAAAEGTDIQVLYHNHNSELLTGSEGNYVNDMIESEGKEIDVYWASKGLDGKVDTALDYVEANADETYLLHVKDGLDGSVYTGEMCGWGKGTYDLQAIVDTAKAHKNIEWVVVENDAPYNFGTTAMEDALQSAEYAKANIDFNYAE